MAFSFAWVDEGEAFTSRNDEDVFAFDLSHLEGEFATLTVELRNPRIGLLGPGRKRWCWFGMDGTPLFKGRLTALPTDIREEVVTLTFVARPSDFDARKRAVADTMRVFPYYDPLWVAAEARDDPDIVLEARPELWHTDRVSHVVTTSNILAGEEGTLDLGDAILADGLTVSFRGAPARRVRVDATCQWTQLAAGAVDISKNISSVFGGDIRSLTATGLAADWPKQGDSIGSGWTFGACSCVPVETLFPVYHTTYTRSGEWIRFRINSLRQKTTLRYDASRTIVEKLAFELRADMQEIMSDTSEAETIVIALQAEDVDQPIDAGAAAPIGDPRRSRYLSTDRGLQSVSYLVALARAQLLARARAVEITLETSLDHGLALSCRKNVRIADPRLPGSAAIGKVAGYSLSLNGDTGTAVTRIVIGCSVGQGGSVAPAAGTAVYAEDYVDGYQKTADAQIGFDPSDVAHGEPEIDVDGYDGIDFSEEGMTGTLTSLNVYNGYDDQKDIIRLGWTTVAETIDALERAPTQIELAMAPLQGGPFETTYRLEATPLVVSKTIDLEASS